MFNFQEKYNLENEIVQLRSLELADFEHLVPFAIHEPELWTYSLVQANDLEKMKSYIEQAVQARVNEKEYPFIVYDKRTNEYAGSTRFYDIQLCNKCLQLGFTWYGKKFQGTGLNKHCKYILLQFAFEVMNMERVEFRADNDNKRSISAMKSIGCKVEGILRSNGVRANGERRDSIVLSILKEEWFDHVQEDLKSKLSF